MALPYFHLSSSPAGDGENKKSGGKLALTRQIYKCKYAHEKEKGENLT
jgi:hypothetical protein